MRDLLNEVDWDFKWQLSHLSYCVLMNFALIGILVSASTFKKR